MRPIKFRQLLPDGTWYYWGFVISDIEFTSPASHNGIYLDSYQFTGLLDKNGVEIWEGDIVRLRLFCDLGGNGEQAQAVVIFKDGGFQIEVISSSKTLYGKWLSDIEHGFCGFGGYSLQVTSIEVIGDIFTTPELLEAHNE